MSNGVAILKTEELKGKDRDMIKRGVRDRERTSRERERGVG